MRRLVPLFVILVVFLGGCLCYHHLHSGKRIVGRVVMPENRCYTDFCPNPAVTNGVPLPEAELVLLSEKEGGQVLSGLTDCKGEYVIEDPEEECYILYAKKDAIRVKQAVLVREGVTEAGEANVYTTAQVIMYERAKERYLDKVSCKDIPQFSPPPALLRAVENALKACEDPQMNGAVIREASCAVASVFGGGGGNSGDGGSGGGGGGDTGCLRISPAISHCSLENESCVERDAYYWAEVIFFKVENAASFPEGTIFSWDFGDGGSAQGPEVDHGYIWQEEYGEEGHDFIVKVTAQHPGLCGGSQESTVTIRVVRSSGGSD